MKLDIVDLVLKARREGRSAGIVTELRTGRQSFVHKERIEGDLPLPPDLIAAIADAFRRDKSRTVEAPGGPVFIEVLNPALKLFVVGAVHIAQPLARMAALAGYRVTIIDPRSAFATDARFPDVTLSTEWPDEAFETLHPDRRSAIVTLTHDPKIDDPALISALRSDAFYIGSLGSKRTHAARLGRLREAGFDEAALARIHGPVGLDIGAVSPAEIAVSILAQIVQVLRAEAE